MSPITPAVIGGFIVCFARATALLFAAPLTGDKTLPPRVRAGVAISLALALAPLRGEVALATLPAVLPLEIALGLLGGFACRLVLAGVEAGGQLIGLQLEMGFAGTFDPSMGEESLPTRKLAHALAGLAFLATDGIEALVRALSGPPARVRTLAAAAASMLDGGATVMTAAVRLAAPLMVAALVANLGAGLVSRAAPALNVFSAAIALVLIVGAVTLLATSPAFVRDIMAAARGASAAAVGVMR